MKNTYQTSKKVLGGWGYCKHLRRDGKKAANKATRRFFKLSLKGD